MKNHKEIILNLIKVFFTITFLYLIFKQINIDNLKKILTGLNIYIFFFTGAMLVTQIIFSAIRLSLILNVFGEKINIFNIFKLTYEGMFFNQVLPTSIGGDTVKIWRLNKYKIKLNKSIFYIITDRVIGFISLLIIFFISLNFLLEEVAEQLDISEFYSFNGFILLLILLLILIVLIYRKKIKEIKNKLIINIKKLAQKKLFLIVFLSFVIHIITFLSFYFLSQALSININLLVFFIIIPLVLTLTLLPISLAGWGLREGILIYCLSFYNISSEQSLAISVLYGLILILTSLPGIYFWFIAKKN